MTGAVGGLGAAVGLGAMLVALGNASQAELLIIVIFTGTALACGGGYFAARRRDGGWSRAPRRVSPVVVIANWAAFLLGVLGGVVGIMGALGAIAAMAR